MREEKAAHTSYRSELSCHLSHCKIQEKFSDGVLQIKNLFGNYNEGSYTAIFCCKDRAFWN
jgi:hypothetical protein